MKKTEKLNKLVEKGLMEMGASKIEDSTHPGAHFVLITKVGALQLFPGMVYKDMKREKTLGYYSRFDNQDEAKKLVDCNPYSGKWNWCIFASDMSVEDFAAKILSDVKKVVT